MYVRTSCVTRHSLLVSCGAHAIALSHTFPTYSHLPNDLLRNLTSSSEEYLTSLPSLPLRPLPTRPTPGSAKREPHVGLPGPFTPPSSRFTGALHTSKYLYLCVDSCLAITC